MIQRHLVLFARAPQLGSGKRRLARDIGAVGALRFERLMLSRSARRLGRDARWRLRFAVTPDRACNRKRLWPRGIPVTGQGGGDLGERMRRALAAPSISRKRFGWSESTISYSGRRRMAASGWSAPAAHRGCRRYLGGCGGQARARSKTRWPPCRETSRSDLQPSLKTWMTAPRTAASPRAGGSDPDYFCWCSCKRGISSTKLQGRKRLSSWWTRMPSQASRQALGEPGSAKR